MLQMPSQLLKIIFMETQKKKINDFTEDTFFEENSCIIVF